MCNDGTYTLSLSSHCLKESSSCQHNGVMGLKCTKDTGHLVMNVKHFQLWALLVHLAAVWLLISVIDAELDYIQWGQ